MKLQMVEPHDVVRGIRKIVRGEMSLMTAELWDDRLAHQDSPGPVHETVQDGQAMVIPHDEEGPL